MERYVEDNLKTIKMHKKTYLISLILIVVINIIAWISTGFCDWYVDNIFPIWINTYARITSIVPVSVGEIMLVLAVIVTVFGVFLFFFNLAKKNKYLNFTKSYGIVYAWIFLAVCYVMTFNCSILYHASSFADKYMVREDYSDMLVADASDDAVTKVLGNSYSKKDLAVLRDYIVKKCNELSMKMKRDDSGAVVYDGDLVTEATKAMKKLGEDYEQLSGFYVTPKYLSCSEFFSQQNIMGYYFPFSLEANINSVMYITNVAPTVCHELSHTKGFMYEDDANFIAYLACINSEDTFLQYCGYLSVLNYVNNDFYESIGHNKNEYKKHVRISDMVADDNIFLTREDWQEVEKKAIIKTSTVKKVSNAVMETTLKANGVEQGMQQYNEVVSLLLDYYEGELY